MDSDLSLIEISGDEDSLLQPLPAGDGASGFENGGRSFDSFLCSPLQLPRTFSKPTESSSGANKERFNMDNANKENMNVEKQETLKLSVEPQQMKRKKKGGGYNLRKSLAWDRAFFTDEGVLDATELSMIIGNFSMSKGKTLSAIEEDSDSSSSDMLTVEENVFKELPAANTSEKTKKVGSSLLPNKRNKEAVTSTSMANRKVLSTHDVNRSGSNRSACPRPGASSSTLKRPASFVTTKVSEKDSKVSKLPVRKPSAPPSRVGKGSTPSARDSKQSQMTQPAVNNQRNFGLKVSAKNTTSVANISKAVTASKSLSNKTSLGAAKRNVTSSVKCFSTNMPLSTEAKKTLEAIPNPLHPSSGYSSIVIDDGSGKVAMPASQNLIAKPTGLRMPSPSMGFFGQTKAPTLQSPLKMTSHGNVPEPNISNLMKLGIATPVSAHKPPLPPKSLPKAMMGGMKTEVIKASETSCGSSNFPSLNFASHETVESSSRVTKVPKVENKLESGENSYEAIKDRNRLRETFGGVDHPGIGRAGQSTPIEDSEQVDLTLLPANQRPLRMQFDKCTNSVDSNVKGPTESERMPYSADLKCEADEPHSLLKDNSVSSQSTGPTLSDSQMLHENTDASPHLQSTELEKEDVITSGVTPQSNMEELVEQELSVNSVVKIPANNSSYTFEIPQRLVASDITEENEPLEISESSLARGHALQDGCTLHVKDSLLTEARLLPDETELENNEPEEEETCRIELKCYEDRCLLPISLLDGGSERTKLVEFQTQDDISAASIDSKPLTQNHDLDNQLHHDVVICDVTTLVKLGSVEEHHVEDVDVKCQNSGQDTSSDTVSAPSIMGLLDCDASPDHRFECVDAEEKKLHPSVASLNHNSDCPEDYLCPNHHDDSNGQTCGLGCEDDVNKHQKDQDKHHTIAEKDEDCEFLYPDIRTDEDSTSSLPEVGLAPMSQDNFSAQVFCDESGTVLEYETDFETEKTDHEVQSHVIKEQEQYVNTEILLASFVAHENITEVPKDEYDVENDPGQRDDTGLEPKTTFPPVKMTQDHEDLGESKESESKVEVEETSNLEIHSSAKNTEVSQKKERESNPSKSDSPKPDLVAEQSERKKAGIHKKPDALVIKRSTNAAPFSDEWLEALEAAGEEMLTMKSGAVQNSPQDRSKPEPSPWSPVKRKHNQTLGPFDCTKHINH